MLEFKKYKSKKCGSVVEASPMTKKRFMHVYGSMLDFCGEDMLGFIVCEWKKGPRWTPRHEFSMDYEPISDS